jgi:hypothetical protein
VRRTAEEVTEEMRQHCQQPTIKLRIMLRARVNSRDFERRIKSGVVELVETKTNVTGAREDYPVKLYQATNRRTRI